jgi:Gram-negative bacterial TonB protein C-terminal
VSPVNLKSGLLAVGALRPEERNSQEPVALETTVIATGARPCDTAAKRELFTEETQTVLVFERGAVIRLSAAVADGQLLFLTNKATGKEVVTQVLCKRAFRPTNCYVDLEFTEACPGFWGIEFPKAGTALASANAAKSLSSDEDSDHKPARPAMPPSLQEVDRLKHEVAELQTQLLSLQTGQKSIPSAAAQIAARAASEIGAGSAKRDEEKQLEDLFAMEAKQEEAQSPKRSLAYPRRSAAGKKGKSGSKTWMVAAGAVIVLIAAAGGAYRYGGFAAATNKTVASKPASTQSQALSPAQAAPVTASPKTTGTAQTSDAKNLVASSGAVPSPEKTGNVYVDDSSITVTEVPAKAPALRTLNSHGAGPEVESKRSKAQPAFELRRKSQVLASNAPVAAGAEKSVGADAAVSSIQDDFVAPKLIKGSKSVSPPEAIQNYIAGNVKVDAVVDTTGLIKSVTILSGPAKLHATATEVMKQYLYEPARKNGKPVPAHVQVSLQVWYAP